MKAMAPKSKQAEAEAEAEAAMPQNFWPRVDWGYVASFPAEKWNQNASPAP